MTGKLLLEAILKFAFGIIIVGFLLFFSAGTFAYWNAWLFMGLLFIPMFLMGILLIIINPNLLAKRLNAKEEEQDQSNIIIYSAILFILGFFLAGLNYRYGWYQMPNIVIIIASVLFIIAYLLYAETLLENEYLSRTIEVQENQKVIDTGLYGIVRHPMYSATILLFLTFPLILGSWPSFFLFLFYPLIIQKRIEKEEKYLEKNLKGYTEYKKKVKYRIIPYIW